MQLDEHNQPSMYLGDSVYATFENSGGYVQLRLTTQSHRPEEAKSMIYLEPQVWNQLKGFVKMAQPPEWEKL